MTVKNEAQEADTVQEHNDEPTDSVLRLPKYTRDLDVANGGCYESASGLRGRDHTNHQNQSP